MLENGANWAQGRALLFLTTLSNALLEALVLVQEAVADLHPHGSQPHPEDSQRKSSPLAGRDTLGIDWDSAYSTSAGDEHCCQGAACMPRAIRMCL